MTSLISNDAIPIVIALLIAIAVGWWMFARRSAGSGSDTTLESAPPAGAATPASREGRGLADEDAAAVADIAGVSLGVDVHSALPGAGGPPDDLTMLKGVGAKLAAKLNECGITRFDQLAGLNPIQVGTLDNKMEPFRGRIARDRLVEQAGYLARGDTEGFQEKFGNLGAAAFKPKQQ